MGSGCVRGGGMNEKRTADSCCPLFFVGEGRFGVRSEKLTFHEIYVILYIEKEKEEYISEKFCVRDILSTKMCNDWPQMLLIYRTGEIPQ